MLHTDMMIGKDPEPWGTYTFSGTGPFGPSTCLSYTCKHKERWFTTAHVYIAGL